MLIFERKVEKVSWDGLAWSLLTPIVFEAKASSPSLLSPSILCLVDHHHTLVKNKYLADAVAVGLRPRPRYSAPASFFLKKLSCCLISAGHRLVMEVGGVDGICFFLHVEVRKYDSVNEAFNVLVCEKKYGNVVEWACAGFLLAPQNSKQIHCHRIFFLQSSCAWLVITTHYR